MDNTDIDKKKMDEDLEFIVRYIREKSAVGHFITYTDFLNPPINLKEERVEEVIEKFNATEEYRDIKELRGNKSRYFFSDLEMTTSYAKLLFGIEEKDILKTIAETIRNDSKRFPKTTNPKVFLSHPFYFNKEELKEILKQLRSKEEFKDIKESKASNDIISLYSDQYLTQDYADALTELVEVTRFETP